MRSDLWGVQRNKHKGYYHQQQVKVSKVRFMPETEAQCQTTGEASLLITCLRGLPYVVPHDTDWQALLGLAAPHGVLLLVHQSFLEKNIEIPGFFATAVREQSNAAKMIAAELECLLKQFAERAIDVLPLKGPALAETLYGDVTMRSCNDLDLLVRREDFERAEVLLSDMGFIARATAGDYHRKFLREGVMVELHFGVGPPRSLPFDLNGAWSRAGRGRFRGMPMRVMSDDDLVLFLCLHGLKHGFSRLIWILDIGRALGKAQHCSPEELAQSARRQGLEQALLIGCELVRETLPRQLPQGMDAVVAASPKAAERARLAVARLFAGAGATNDLEIWCSSLQTDWSARRRWRRRLGFFAPTITDYAWAERHRIYRGLAPILRPFRVLQKYGPSKVWRFLFPPHI